MLVIDDEPAGSVDMVALLRDWAETFGGAAAAPAWTSPSTGSFSRNGSVRPKFDSWELKLSSVKPSRYAKSCIRLWTVKRFTAAAETSRLLPTTRGRPGPQSSLNHSLVHG